MYKFIFATLFFLSWAFYELSGGENFVPGAQMTENASAADVTTQPLPTSSGGLIAAAQAADASAQIQPAVATATDLVEVAVARPQDRAGVTMKPIPVKAEVIEPPKRDILAQLDPSVADLPRATISPVVFDETGIGTTLRAEPVTPAAMAAPAEDMRRVTGNRVNLRMGPGTKFNVLTSLSQGDQVIVLQQPGNGWVKLKSVDGNKIGWMADYLVSAAE